MSKSPASILRKKHQFDTNIVVFPFSFKLNGLNIVQDFLNGTVQGLPSQVERIKA